MKVFVKLMVLDVCDKSCDVRPFGGSSVAFCVGVRTAGGGSCGNNDVSCYSIYVPFLIYILDFLLNSRYWKILVNCLMLCHLFVVTSVMQGLLLTTRSCSVSAFEQPQVVLLGEGVVEIV